MTAGDILDTAIRIFRHNFVPLVIIVAIVNVPVALLQFTGLALFFPLTGGFGNLSESFDPSVMGSGVFLVTAIAGFLGAIATIFQQGALTHFVSERFLGRPVTVRQAYGKAFRRWLALLLGALFVGVAVGGVFFCLLAFLFVPLLGASLAGGGSDAFAPVVGLASLLMCCLFIPALVVAIFLYVRWIFWVPAIIIENYNSTGGMGRSWKLVKGTFWRVLGFTIILYVIVTFFSAGPIYLITFFSFLLPSPFIGFLLNSIVSTIIVMFMTPLSFAVLTVLYYDLRIRKEGFDLQMQMQAQDTSLDLPSLLSDSAS